MSALLGQGVQQNLCRLISIEALFRVSEKLIESCRLALKADTIGLQSGISESKLVEAYHLNCVVVEDFVCGYVVGRRPLQERGRVQLLGFDQRGPVLCVHGLGD